MEWLRSPELQGIAALTAILQIIIIAGKGLAASRGASTGREAPASSFVSASPRRSITAHIIGGLVVVTLAWLFYSIPWAAMAFAMRFPAHMVFSMMFFMLGSFTAAGALLTRWTPVGGFLGGGLPLGMLALFYASSTPEFQATASPFTWFIVFLIFGGLLGALSGPAAIKSTELLGLPLPTRS